MYRTDFAAIIPSRGRPQNIKRFIKAAWETTNRPEDIDIYVGIDADDPTLEDYKYLTEDYDFELVISPERKRFGPTLNDIAVSIADQYEYIFWCGDDHVPLTNGWVDVYAAALKEMQVGIVYGDDLIMGESIATELAMTSNIVTTLGYAVPEGFTHLFIDNYFMRLAGSINKLKYIPDVVIQHMHYIAGSSQEDLTYREANSDENWTNDRVRFEKYLDEELQNDQSKLASLLENLK